MHIRYGIISIILFLLFMNCGTSRFRSPRVIDERKLDYPLSAMLDKVEGNVVVGVFVSADGTAEEVRLLESSGNDDLDNAALEFAKGVKFEPALLDEEPVGAWTKLVMRYKLSEVFFEHDKWFTDVNLLLDRAKKEQDADKKESILKSVYSKYYGMINYVERNPDDLSVNGLIRRVVLDSVYNRYRDVARVTQIPFALFEDFVSRFPDSQIVPKAREDLVLQLVETEFRMRIKGLKSASYARKSMNAMELVRERLNQLQKIKVVE